jgi:hypothetical protein
VGALSFIKAEEKIPTRSLLVGNPAKIIRQVSDEMIKWKSEGTALYQQLPGLMKEGGKPCDPVLIGIEQADGLSDNEILPEIDPETGLPPYRPWKKI